MNLSIEGWMTPEELQWLTTTAQQMRSVAEIGCWKGRTTYNLCESCPGTVFAVDHWRGSEFERSGPHREATVRDIFEDFRANVGHFPNLQIMRGESVKIANQMLMVDMVFIDAGHTYNEVKADIAAWLPKAEVLICGHDYNEHAVRLAVKDMLPNAWNPAGSIWAFYTGDRG